MSDVTEKNTSGSEKNVSNDSENEKGAAPQANSEEYAALIDFIRAQKNNSDDEGDADEHRVVKKRNWLTPWKVKEIRVNKNGEEEEVAARVPASW